MASRLDLHGKLLEICQHVYFQPPESVKLVYPCIVYARNDARIKYADNQTYGYRKAYSVTIIDKSPDSAIVDQMFTKFPMLDYDRNFESDGLNHDIFTIYY